MQESELPLSKQFLMNLKLLFILPIYKTNIKYLVQNVEPAEQSVEF